MMKIDGRNRFFKAVLLVCVIMQAVALMPHHHHADSETVCLNYTHVSHDGESDVCAKDHDHSKAHPYTSCNSYNIVVAQPEYRNDDMEEVVSDLPDCGCGICVTELIAEIFNGDIADEAVDDVTHTGESESYLRVYLATARPTRAPDFIG